MVHTVYGSAIGLTFVGNQLWTRDTPGILGYSTGVLQMVAGIVALLAYLVYRWFAADNVARGADDSSG